MSISARIIEDSGNCKEIILPDTAMLCGVLIRTDMRLKKASRFFRFSHFDFQEDAAIFEEVKGHYIIAEDLGEF